MGKCRLCGEINNNFINSEENQLNSETVDNRQMQILAERLLKFEGYEINQNKNELIWMCDDCREKLESFDKFLKIVKKGQEEWHPVKEEQKITVLKEFNEIQNSELIDNKTPTVKGTKPKNETCCDDLNKTGSLNDLPRKRVRRPPKRYQDNEFLITKRPIQIISNTVQSTYTTSMALLHKIAELRLSNGRTIAHLMEADNYEKSFKCRIKCTICPSIFRFEKEYRKHLEDHKDEIQNNLKTLTQFNSNEEKSHFSLEKFLYYCEICQKSFPEHVAVRRHYKQAHLQERTYSCGHCTAKFKYKFNLDYHMAKHVDKKNHECSYCKKKFVLRYELMIHQRIHTNEKPYKCQICSISFAHRSNLVKHRKLHTQTNSLKCSMCQASFRNLVYLKRHEKIHSKSQEKENLLQTTDNILNSKSANTEAKKIYDLQDFEKYCIPFSTISSEKMDNTSFNMSLPDFDSLQCNIKSVKLNTNDANSSSNLEYISNNVNDDFTMSPKTIEILKKPTTHEYFDEIMHYNGKLIKSESESGSFRIGNTTLKILPKTSVKKMEECFSSQQNNEEFITTSSNNNNFSVFPDLRNSTNSSNFINMNSIDLKNPTTCPYSKNYGNSIISLENDINTTNSMQISNNTISFANSPLTKTLQNHEELEKPSHSTTINTFYNISSSNMTNLNSSKESTNKQNEDNFKFSIEKPFTNCPKKFPLLKFNDNSHFIDFNNQGNVNMQLNQFDDSFSYTTTQFPIISLPQINTKPLKIVKLSEDYLKTKNAINYNSNNQHLKLHNSSYVKITNFTDSNGKLSAIDPNIPKKMPKLKYFSDNITKLNSSQNNKFFFAPTLNLKNPTHEPVTIFSHDDGIIKSESCLISPPIQISKEDIIHTNIATENYGEIVNIITDQSPPNKLPALKIFKTVPLLKTLDNQLNMENFGVQNSAKTDAKFLNNQTFIQNLPYFWDNSINILPNKETTNCDELLTIETFTNSSSNVENTTNSLLMKCPVTQDRAHIFTPKIKESSASIDMENSSTNPPPFKISKAITKVEMKAKPVKIYDLNNVENLFINSSLKNMPIKIITKPSKSHNINTLNDSTTPVKVSNNVSPHSTIRKTPLKLKISSKHSLLKTDIKPTEMPDSSLIPKVSTTKVKNQTTPSKTLISCNSAMITTASIKQLKNNSSPSKPLITNVEYLPPLTLPQLLNTSLNTPSTSTTQNLVQIPVEYKFQCNNCGKYFKQKSTLNKHLRTHTGDKPYKCYLCPKSYADASNYKKHKILHKNAAHALNISPHLPLHPVHNSPTHSIASDPDPDGVEVMQTIKKFECSSSAEDDVESLTSSTMESYMWEDALDHAIMNEEVRENRNCNLFSLNSAIMPSNRDEYNNLTPLLNLTSEDPEFL